jgi:acyl-CoA synthetase (AMP-forming)/AMP-acid ligase II
MAARRLDIGSSWERIADHRGDALALRHADRVVTWAEFDRRASALAGAFASAGIGAGDNVAEALFNDNEYLETEFAAFKVRAAPCNVNYRYVAAELAHLIDDSDAKAVVFDASLAERFDAIRSDLPDVRLWIQVGDESCPDWATPYEQVVAHADPAPRIRRSPDDLWILYTGGTTGRPKGVMWSHELILGLSERVLAEVGLAPMTSLDDVVPTVDALAELGATPRQLAASPLMHGTAGLGALVALACGGAVVTLPGRSFDAVELWRTVESTSCTTISIVGDVFCVPMVDELESAIDDDRPYELSPLTSVRSSGVMWSQSVKDRLVAAAAACGSTLTCIDTLGASEGVGFAASQSSNGSGAATATFQLGPNAAIFDEAGNRVEPGSGEIGMLAVTGAIPLGYYGDPVKTAATFREFEGRRWSVPGDWATVDADGTVTLLGRGSACINTGGEKVFPEEVEEELKLLDVVADVNVVGVPDPKWGSAVTAVIELRPGSDWSDDRILEALRSRLAGYKIPKHIVRVDRLHRNPNGKSDHRWARTTAARALGIEPAAPG